MANCIYFSKNGFGYTACTSTEHPNYKRGPGASFEKEVPKQCANGGKGCPVLKKENKK